MSRHQHHQLKPVASGAHAHAHATPGSSSSGSRRSSDARANTNTLTYDQLEPGTGLPTGRLHGRLKLLFKEKPDELDFAIKVKLAAASDYVQGQKQQRNIMARFVLIPSPSDNAAFPAEVTQTMAANYALLRRSLGSPFTVECAGCKVASRRTMGDGTTEVTFRATGSRLITIDGTGHEFLKIDPPQPASTPSDRPRVDDWFSPSPAPPARQTNTAELTRGDVTRRGVAPPLPTPAAPAPASAPGLAGLRPLSEVPQFVLRSHGATVSAVHERRPHPPPAADASAIAAGPGPAAPAVQNVSNNWDAARVPAGTAGRDRVDRSAHASTSMARPSAQGRPSAMVRPLPPPSSVTSRLVANNNAPSTTEHTAGATASEPEPESEAAAKFNLDLPDGVEQKQQAHQVQHKWSTPGTGPSVISPSYFPDKQFSAIEVEAKRRSLAAGTATSMDGEGERAERVNDDERKRTRFERSDSDHQTGIARRPVTQVQAESGGEQSVALAGAGMQKGDATEQAPQSERDRERDQKRPREDEAEPAGQKKPRLDGPSGIEPHVQQADATTRAAAEDSALRKRQAQLRAAEEAAAQRRADVEQLRRPFKVHVRHEIRLPADAQGRSSRTYVTLREAASRTAANVAAVIVDVKGLRTTPTGDRSLTIVIADPSSHTNGNASEDMVVTLFRKTDVLLTQLRVGMPVIFRTLKITTYNNKAKGQMYSNGPCTMLALRDSEVLQSEPAGEGLSPAEMERLTSLDQWWKDNGESAPAGGVAAAPGESGRGSIDAELGSVKEWMYFQLTAKINTRGGNFPKYELYISDGTINPDNIRDFLGVAARYPWLPRGGLFTLAVHNDPEGPAFAPGQVVRFPNVRVKRYDNGLELAWSDKVTLQQQRDGWKARRHTLLKPEDERAQVINKRLKDWKRGRVPAGQEHVSAPDLPEPEIKPDPEPAQERIIASHLRTKYADPLHHQPTASLAAMRENSTVPNRYRILVRVKELVGRGARGSRPEDLAVLWCSKCGRAFAETHCRSCEDSAHRFAEVRWQFVAVLEDEVGGELVVALSGPQANSILPALPTPTPQSIGKLRSHVIPALRPKVENILQGALFDGKRTRPLIDMTLESYAVNVQGEEVVVWRVFGMETVG